LESQSVSTSRFAFGYSAATAFWKMNKEKMSKERKIAL
jgi:hypothetical protein